MEEITVAGSIAVESIDFSMLSLFLRADFVVKSVIIILILASLYSWTIIVAKLIRIRQLKNQEKEKLWKFLLPLFWKKKILKK